MNKPTAIPVQPENIPAPLKAIDRWVVWRYEQRKGKWAKPPRQTNDRYAASNDPHTWCSFTEAVEAYQSGKFDGIGIVLPEGIVGVDLDDCLIDGKATETAKLLRAMLPTYCEVSPSGEGLKLLATGNLNKDLAKTNKSKGVELYDGGDTNRYFTVTGNIFEQSSPITVQRDSLFAIQGMITEPRKVELDYCDDVERAARAIELIDHISTDRADHYDDWLALGMALHWCDSSDAMLEAWLKWSEHSDKFDEDICRSKWDSFKREDGRLLTIAHLERLAKEDGYDPDKFQTESICATELLAKRIERDYLIDDFMVINEPMIVGGASKSLKTSVSLEMALSIATGTKFLNKFAVKQPHKVMFLSGESGEATLQENLSEMVKAKSLDPRELWNLHLSFKLPKLNDPKTVDDLIAELQQKEIGILFLDPLYRSLRVGDQASNIYSMGEQLELIATKIHRAGISVILLHHFRKQGRSYGDAPALEDLSQSGIAEFGRQFLLLKRREEYQHDGKHALWFSWGGSAGHQGEAVLEVYTGTRKLGLTWQTTLRSRQEWEASQKDMKQLETGAKMDVLRERILEVIGANPGIKTQELIGSIGGKESVIREILEELSESLEVHFSVGPKNSKRWFANKPEGLV